MTGLNVCMVGTGEYTTGFVHDGASDSDKSAGVVGIVMFDLRSRGKVDRLAMCGTTGSKFPAIRQHMDRAIAAKYPQHGFDLSFDSFPSQEEKNPLAYERAFTEWCKPGDAVTVFVPDDKHFEIAMAAISRGLHVLLTKPPVKTLAEHKQLIQAAKDKGVLVMVEVHKRFDPIYSDAYDRIQASLGDISFMDAYMSQPKHQLDTFRHWAGKSSDISYYLNSHHIDFCEWATAGRSRPVRVSAAGAVGVAQAKGIDTEDTISLLTNWENTVSKTMGIGVFTSSWVAPKADVHSQQRFFFLGQKGEVRVEQAHRGYSCATDEAGYSSCNPLFMKYTAKNGKFAGQQGYGYQSLERFVDACNQINAGKATPSDFDGELPTIGTTVLTTAVLEAGRVSLDSNGRQVEIRYEGESHMPASLHVL